MTTGSKAQVMNGTVSHTTGRLTKKHIKVVTKKGVRRYVSKAKSELAKKNFGNWHNAVAKAKKKLGIKKGEMVLINKGSEGKRLYKEAKKLYKNKKKASLKKRSSKKRSSKKR